MPDSFGGGCCAQTVKMSEIVRQSSIIAVDIFVDVEVFFFAFVVSPFVDLVVALVFVASYVDEIFIFIEIVIIAEIVIVVGILLLFLLNFEGGAYTTPSTFLM